MLTVRSMTMGEAFAYVLHILKWRIFKLTVRSLTLRKEDLIRFLK